MQTHHTPHYNRTSRILHWLMFALMLVMLATVVLGLMTVHKICGGLLLVLAIIRMGVAIKSRHQRPTNTAFVKIGHTLLYVLMVAVPASGLALVVLQPPISPHKGLAILLFLLIVGHIAMAIIHQIKGEKLLQRMWG